MLVVSTVVFAACGVVSAARAEHPSATRLLPKETVAMVSLPDVRDAGKRFMSTTLGRMCEDPQMKPLVGDLYDSLVKLGSRLEEQIGLSVPQLLAIPQGEFTVAIVATEEEGPAGVLMLDTGDQLSSAQVLLKLASQGMIRAGAERSNENLFDTTVGVYHPVGRQRRTVVCFEKDATVVFSTHLSVVRQMLSAWTEQKGPSLADNMQFTSVMRHCGDPSQSPQFFWYANPIALLRSLGQEQAGVRVALAMLPSLGLDGLSAVGGTVRMDAGELDSVSHSNLMLGAPRDGVLEMIALGPVDPTPQRWVPADVTSYVTLQWNFDKTFKVAAELFDSFQGEGALSAALQQRFTQTSGVDIEKDLLSALAGRVSYIQWIAKPVTLESSTNLLAFELKEDSKLDEVLDKLGTRFSGFLKRRSYGGIDYYQISPPGLARRELQPGQPAPPQPCFGLIDGSLIFTDRESFFKQVIVTAKDSSESLADTLDFKLIASKITREAGSAKPVMISFARPEESLRFMYELAIADGTRQGLRRRAENNPLFKSLDAALETHPLPPFAVLQRYLAPAGSLLLDDSTGLHYVSFALRREQQ
jgi:hypothetical protein